MYFNWQKIWNPSPDSRNKWFRSPCGTLRQNMTRPLNLSNNRNFDSYRLGILLQNFKLIAKFSTWVQVCGIGLICGFYDIPNTAFIRARNYHCWDNKNILFPAAPVFLLLSTFLGKNESCCSKTSNKKQKLKAGYISWKNRLPKSLQFHISEFVFMKFLVFLAWIFYCVFGLLKYKGNTKVARFALVIVVLKQNKF